MTFPDGSKRLHLLDTYASKLRIRTGRKREYGNQFCLLARVSMSGGEDVSHKLVRSRELTCKGSQTTARSLIMPQVSGCVHRRTEVWYFFGTGTPHWQEVTGKSAAACSHQAKSGEECRVVTNDSKSLVNGPSRLPDHPERNNGRFLKGK